MSFSTFDHHSSDLTDNRDDVLRALRQECPIGRSELYGGYWAVMSNELVHDVLRDDTNFSVERTADGGGGILIPAIATNPSVLPGEVDGPPHAYYRKVLSAFFSRNGVEKVRPMIERITDRILDDLANKPEFDVVVELGNLVPINTILEWFGLPAEDGLTFLEAIEEGYIIDPDQGDADQAVLNFQKVWSETSAIIAAKIQDPGDGDDILGQLIRRPDIDLDRDELLQIGLSVVLGGTRTTGSLIASSLWLIDGDPALRGRLRNDPASIRPAIEEILRLSSPSVSLARTAVNAVSLGDCEVDAGDRVLIFYASANRDETVFENPDDLDIDRDRVRQHVAFGHGPHRCVGEWLARMETEVILTKMFERFPDFSIDRERTQRTRDQGVLALWDIMPCSTNLSTAQ